MLKRIYLHPNHLDPVDSSSSSLGKELCQGLLSYGEKTETIKNNYFTTMETWKWTTIQIPKSSTQCVTYPAGLLASLLGCWGVGFCCWFWPLITTDSQLLSVVVPAEACSNQNMVHPLTFTNKKSKQKMKTEGGGVLTVCICCFI